MSERYPLINQPGGATVVPIIDNFYLDMNGIIHNCTHGNREDVKLTEDEMIVRIFNYLDKLFHIVKPQKLIFMAIDGALPLHPLSHRSNACSPMSCTANWAACPITGDAVPTTVILVLTATLPSFRLQAWPLVPR